MATLRIDAPSSVSLSTPFARKDDRSDDPRVKRIRQVDPSFSAVGKSEFYLDERCRLLDGPKEATATPTEATTSEHEDADPVAAARAAMIARHEGAWKPKTPAPVAPTSAAKADDSEAIGPVEAARLAMVQRHARAWRKDGVDVAESAVMNDDLIAADATEGFE